MVSLSQSENASLMATMFHDISSLKDTTTSLIKKFDSTVSSSNDNITSLRASLSSVEKTTTSLKKDVDVINKRKSFTFKISDYSIGKEVNLTFYSEPFYTSCEGYRIRIEVDPDGNEYCDGTHVSVYIRLLKSSNDQKLQWPFLGTVTVELLNQLADDNHHSVRRSFNLKDNVRVGIAHGHLDFIPHLKLFHDVARNTQYLLHDTLYFRAAVEVKSHVPWLECSNSKSKEPHAMFGMYTLS